MKAELNDYGVHKEVKKDDNVFTFNKLIELSSKEAKEKIVYKSSDGFCSVIIEGKEVEGMIISLSSKGNVSIGVNV